MPALLEDPIATSTPTNIEMPAVELKPSHTPPAILATTATENAGSYPAIEATSPPTPPPTNQQTNTPDLLIHTVRTGQNLSEIATRYGVSVNDIITQNNISNPHLIKVGDVLLIPEK